MEKHPLALLGADAPVNISQALTSLGFVPLLLDASKHLPKPTRSHADMLIFCAGNCIFSSKDHINKSPCTFEKLKEYGYSIVESDTALGDRYPYDIPFNMALIGNYIFGNIKFASKEIIDYASKNSIELISVKQGYTKCSTVVINHNAIITADSGIESAARGLGIDTLNIENSPSSVSLAGYDYGFLGGACGVYQDKIYFVGNISRHPNGIQIIDFCHKHGLEVISLSDTALTDIGGIIFLDPLN